MKKEDIKMGIKKFENFEENFEEKSYEGEEFDTYLHGYKEDGFDLIRRFGLNDDDPLYGKLLYINYEVKIRYKIIDGEPVMISVNGVSLER